MPFKDHEAKKQWDRDYKRKHPQTYSREYGKEYYASHKKHLREYQIRRRKERKIRVIEKYGGKCACCGEKRIEFMTMDHINNDGGQERKKYGEGNTPYNRLDKLPVDRSKYQVLCFNCNCAKQYSGYCPHQKMA